MRLVAALLAACGCLSPLSAVSWGAEPGVVRAEPREQLLPVTEGLAKTGKLRGGRVHPVLLALPSAQKAAPEQRPAKGAPLRIGFARAVMVLKDEGATASALDWQPLADGSRVADVSVTSPGASAVRLGIRAADLPDSAILRFTKPEGDRLFETSGRKVNEAIARNVAAGDASTDARIYWSPVIEGDTIVVEVELPPGIDPGRVRVAMPVLGHLFTSPANAFATPTTIGQSGSCEVDAMCSSGWTNQMNSVAEMIFSDGTGTFLCTGTLLADQDAGSSIPYFLSANHCISTQTAASSLTTYWFYRSSACNSGTPGAYRQLTGGATLLYHSLSTDSRYTDTSFMRLDNTPPQGAYFAGWLVASTPAAGTAITALHQPSGDLLKISEGAVNGYLDCTAPSSGSFSCSGASASSSSFYDVGWTSGITEPGSSGSGIFLSGGYLVGQLYGGSGDCTTPGDDAYGRLDVAYNAALRQWLSAPLALTVSKSGAGTGTVTSTPAGIACGATCSATFAPGAAVTLAASASPGSSFTGWGGACSGTGACAVTMSSAQSVTASFTGSATLTVTTVGNGTVKSSPAGIDCGTACSASFALGTAVALSATPAAGMAFTGWTGACSGTGSCAVTMNGPTSVGATFGAPQPVDLAVSQSASPNPATAAKDVVFTVDVTNPGPGSASAVTVTDVVPAGATFVTAWPRCLESSGTITCSLGPLPAGGTTQAFVVLRPSAAGSLANTASVTAPEPDPSSSNNADTTAVPVNATPSATLANISTRMQVLTGNDVLIGGFVIGGSASKTVVVRARGPSLVPFGIANALANPTLTLVRSSDQSTIATNDDWGAAPNASQLSATGFAPSDPRESAILATLAPGAYTAIVAGAGGATGVGMVEVFEVDHPEVPLTNLSARGAVLTGNDVMIGGFVLQGNGPQTVVVRARGPSLGSFGIANPLQNPTLTLVRSSDQTAIAANDDWTSAFNASQISADGLAPSDPRESAILVTLDPGAYTAIVSGAGGTTGVGLVEIFEP